MASLDDNVIAQQSGALRKGLTMRNAQKEYFTDNFMLCYMQYTLSCHQVTLFWFFSLGSTLNTQIFLSSSIIVGLRCILSKFSTTLLLASVERI